MQFKNIAGGKSVRGFKNQAKISVSLAALFAASVIGRADAQTLAAASAPVTPASSVEEIVVTGSRIVRDGYEAPTPVTVIGADAIEAAARNNLADFVNELPALAGSLTPQANTGNVSNGIGGINALNLRNLGRQRTLVLLDGQRSVGASADNTVDVSGLPQQLVARVDIVTGGASAAYGSDAVSGVVNFVLDKNFVGLKGEVSGGVSTYGDDRYWKTSLSGGTAFGNGRGHFLFSGELSSNDGILHGNVRDWNQQGYFGMPNPAYTATNGAPQYIFGKGIGFSTATEGGIIVNTALKGTAFGQGGVPYQFNYGSLVAGNFMQGGDWGISRALKVGTIDPPESRQSVFTRASYDLTDNVTAFLSVSWGHTRSVAEAAYGFNYGNLTISAANPFLPASVATQAAAAKITQFTLGRFETDMRTATNGTIAISGDNQRRVNRYVVGVEGKFNAFETDWHWNAYYQKGVTLTSEHGANIWNSQKFALALDSVRNAQGTIVCRSTLTNPSNGCVPYNPFGTNVNSQAAVNYAAGGGPERHQHLEQDVAAAVLDGEPFSNWAGPISVSTGVEWRREQISGTADAVSAVNGWFNANYLPTLGKYSVAEGFVETVVPLAKNTVWAQSLDLNAAARFTGYSTFGTVTTWKVGLTYQPIEDIRVRATRSRDIRAPNLGDLFNGGSTSAGALFQDPFNGNVSVQGNTLSRGNPALTPEKADTSEAGVVLQPRFFPGFTASADYWNLDMTDSIGSLTGQQILNQCFKGLQAYCNAVTRQAGVIIVRVQPFNVASQIARGWDFEASYRLPLADVVDSWNGSLSLRGLATRYLKNYSNNTITPPVDTAGSNGANGPPKWVFNTSLIYNADPMNISLTMRGLSSGTNSNTYIQCTSGCPASTTDRPTVSENFVPGATYFDASVSYKVGVASLFLSIQNLMNKDPALVVGIPAGGPQVSTEATNATYYSPLGRMFRAGVRFKM